MANENKRRFIEVEDYSAATTTDVIPNEQVRWFNKVPGYSAAEIIELVGNAVDDIATLARRQWLTDTTQTLYGVKTFDDIPVLPASNPTSDNQAARKKYVDDNVPGINFTFDVEDTTSSDVAATTPSSPGDGDQWTVVNSGSSGNYVTGLPGSIKLADDKKITFTYDATNATWRYEDIIIDYYVELDGDSINQHVTKWSGGKMVINREPETGAATMPVTFVESFNTAPHTLQPLPRFSATVTSQSAIEYNTITASACVIKASAATNYSIELTVVGRWKA
jgi:hypothetical protein